MSTDQTDKFDNFFRGDMSSSDMDAMRAEIDGNPELSEEFEFQSDLVQGIQNHRKSQLKERLANVDVSGGLLPTQSFSLKLAGYIGISSAVILGMLYIPWSKAESELVLMEGPEVETVLDDISPVKIFEEVKAVEKEKFSLTEESTARLEATAKNVPVKVSEEIDSNVFLPVANTEIGTTDFDPVQIEEEIVAPHSSAVAEKQLEVATFDAENENLSYRYFDGKLSLYGNFGNSPYHILEINKQGGKNLFLFHAGDYYKINSRSTPSPLDKILDPEIIRELDIFQEEK